MLYALLLGQAMLIMQQCLQFAGTQETGLLATRHSSSRNVSLPPSADLTVLLALAQLRHSILFQLPALGRLAVECVLLAPFC